MSKKKSELLNSLPERFMMTVDQKKLFDGSTRILLACSGGIDSVALFHLLRLGGYNFSVAHCNFKLRGIDSDKDEIFVKKLCQKYHVPCFTTTFETESYSRELRISTQMAARDLRYGWFHDLLKEHKLELICTAHHLNDSVETVLLNLSRETGLRGIRGMRYRNGNLVRPLLFAGRTEIFNFVKENTFRYRKDRSNDEIKYKRNLVRKKIIPQFESINPSFIRSFARSLEHFNDASDLLDEIVNEKLSKIVSYDHGTVSLNIEELDKSGHAAFLLFRILGQVGISAQYHPEVMQLLSSQAGRIVNAGKFTVLKDRSSLMIRENREAATEKAVIYSPAATVQFPVSLSISKTGQIHDLKLDKSEIIVDSSAIIFPLIVRKWEPGDVFFPFGMKGRKKISDLLVDLKIPRTKKEHVFVLENGDGKIIWVIGLRADDRFKISKRTTAGLIVKLGKLD